MASIKQRRGTKAEWTAANPVLADGEMGFERDTNKVKIGNGVDVWAALKYLVPEPDLVAAYRTARDT